MEIRDFFQKTIKKSYVINLRDSIYRYNHINFEFSKFNISNFLVEKAVSPLDEEVKNKFKNNEISPYPPCFRCGYDICNHKNNIITPSQVANFLSFRNIMKKVSINESGLYTIFEDDFFFKENINNSISKINKLIKSNNLINSDLPVLIRIGSHTPSSKKEDLLYKYLRYTSVVKNKYNMANPCFIFNTQFANLFLENFNKIEVTSDTFIHKVLCENNNVLNYSVKPFPIGQHSHGKENNLFSSQIVEGSYSNEKFTRAHSKSEYLKLLNDWFES
tara:strand:- start:273 stop:1097 length:825 start_codon:yes stop_codon:yes gene_type:complete